jgi:hypothetical protein
MLILALGLKRRNQDEKLQREKFKKQVKSFIRKSNEHALKNRGTLDDWLTAMVSVGAYQQIL